MNRTRILIIAAVVVVALVALGAYVFLGGESGVASENISAPTLEASSQTVFNIVPEESEVTFALSELLFGTPTSVVGRTEDVAGQILVDYENSSISEVGTIRINVRTLVTSEDMRNRAIRRAILLSDQPEFEFAEFANTELSGLPETVTIGEAFTFEITGDFTLRGITNRITFAARVTPVSETEISGSASTVIQRAMYELTIPNAPGVADVSEDVTLTINFIARAEEPA